MREQKYKAVIWDMDGTLLNTIEDLTDGVNHIMEQYHYPLHTVEEVKHFVGNGIERLMELATPNGKENPAFSQMFQAFKEYYTAHCNLKTGLYPGVKDAIMQLKSMGYRQAIVSNKNHSAVLELAEIYFGDAVDAAIGQRDGVNKKPAPDMVYQALEALGAEKAEAVYVGDSEVDVMTAKNSGLDGIAVAWGFRTREELILAGAKTIVNDTEELLSELI